MRVPFSPRRRLLALGVAGWLGVTALAVAPQLVRAPSPETCPPGYELASERRPERLPGPDAAPGFQGSTSYADRDAGLDEVLADAGACIAVKHPESFSELAIANAERISQRTAPADHLRPGAYENAYRQTQALRAAGSELPGSAGTWAPYGSGPLQSADEGYEGVNGLGLVEVAGRPTDLVRGAEPGTVYASIANGGVWRSDDLGATWRSIGETLPTQVVGGIGYSTANGGTLIVVTGDGSFGANSYTGLGAFYSTDDGATWTPSEGVPTDAFGFKVAVDPSNPEVVYAATGAGLYRSSDAGRTFANVNLPTGECAGRSNLDRPCLFANMVTDVVVQSPGGTGAATGGRVTAAVGWRSGDRPNPDGTPQSPRNGIYLSDTGETDSFRKSSQIGFAPQERIGRIELGAAFGEAQDHDYLYAVVQDAVFFNNGAGTVDAPEAQGALGSVPTAFNGVYVSSDFGGTWTLMATGEELQSPTTGSALAVVAQSAGFGPGVQAWYDMYVQPDPTRQLGGVPTRLTFGLEEIWQNEFTNQPQNAKSSFKVIGRYFSGETCLFLDVGQPACPTDRDDPLQEVTTTHPDQQAGLYVPTEDGVVLVAANDGGVYTQPAARGEEFVNSDWGVGSNQGFNTLLPYFAQMSKDGTVWMGLQDNGTAKIQPDGRKVMAQGGDGFYVAVDPDDSNVAYGETPFASMTVTTDGGLTFSPIPPPITNTKFSNPFVMDPKDSLHLLTAGREVVETVSGPGTGSFGWLQVFDLGTANRPGDPEAPSDDPDDPANSMSAVDLDGVHAYVGFCGVCDVLNTANPFRNGLTTNVGGDQPPALASSDGWHLAAAEGLPNRYISAIEIDPADPRTLYVTLQGYSRRWTPPGAIDDPMDVGEGHVFKSTDAGQTFTDISGNLPDIPAVSVVTRGDQLVVGTDLGVFVSSDLDGSEWAPLGTGLPNVAVSNVQIAPQDPDLLVAGTYGRGVYTYRFADPAEVRRVAGPSRIETAIETSQELFDAADSVVLARADVYADALAGGPYAGTVDAPILLSNRDALSPQVAEEVQRLGATTAYLLGGEQALSAQVIADLRRVGIENVVRIGGTNRFDTARLIAAQIGGDEVYVAEGANLDPARGWPDALAVAPLAATQRRPILLVTAGELPPETARALDERAVTDATIVGGSVAVGFAVEEAIATQVDRVGRVAGNDRYETSALVADRAIAAGLDPGVLWLAQGGNWPDALASAPTVSASGGILLLVDPQDLDRSPASRQWIDTNVPELPLIRLLGGDQAIATRVEEQVRALTGIPR